MTNKLASADHLLTTHESMIARLRERFPEVQTTGFFRALAKCGNYMADILKNDPDWRARVNIVPDAFAIDHEGGHVAVFEIVDTHDVTEHKIACVNEIGWALDQDGYDIAIIRIDRYGAALIDPVGDELTRLVGEVA
jgi:hypothetical protein